jgi:nicotinamidase-related amidase
MDISNLIHTKSTPADVIYLNSATQHESKSVFSPAFPGPLDASHKKLLLPAYICRTALLVIDTQRGLNVSHGYYGKERSTPVLEANIENLLSACRNHNSNAAEHSSQDAMSNRTSERSDEAPYRVGIVHVHHHSVDPKSPLHPSGRTQQDGVLPMPCAAPQDIEPVVTKSVNSAFCGTNLAEILADAKIQQLIVVGIATDHCVSTSIRWAKDLGIIKADGGGHGSIVIASDATACFEKGGIDAETVQRVHLASLEGEFATVLHTEEILRALFA